MGKIAKPLHPSAGALAAYVCILLMLATALVYGPLLTTSHIGPEDRAFRYEIARPMVWNWSEIKSAFQRRNYPHGTAGYYQPLTSLSLMLDSRLAGYAQARVFQFHLTNLALHVANTALVFMLLRSLSSTLLWPALLTLLFGLHPLAVETIASIAQRMTLLATFFSLLALLCYQRHVRAGHAGWLSLVTLLYAAAMLSKPTFVGLPVLLLILDVWPFRRAGVRPLTEKIPLLALAMLCLVVQYSLRANVPPARGVEVGAAELVFRNVASFVTRIVWPEPLSPAYPLAVSPVHDRISLILDAVKVAALCVLLVIGVGRSRPVFAGLAGAVVLVAPGLMNIPFTDNLLGDSHLYVVLLAPVFAAAAWLTTRGDPLRRPAGRLAAMTCFAVVALFAVKSYAYCFVWQTSTDVYRHVVALYPQWTPGRVRLVEACIADNELDAALLQAQWAVANDPDDPSVQFYLGTVLLLHGDSRCAEAIAPLQRALTSNTNWIACLQNLGVALARSGKLMDAIANLEKARDLAPDSVGIRIALGNAYLQAKRSASARGEFQEALRLRSDPDIHLGLAVAWAASDVPDLARKHLAAAVAADPRMAAKAGSYPDLRRLREQPGFSELIDVTPEGRVNDSATADKHGVANTLETATNAEGS